MYKQVITLTYNITSFIVRYSVVWEKFDTKKFSSLVWHDENWTNEIFLTMNKKIMHFIHWRLQGMKIFYHEQISHENIQRWIFPNYSNYWYRVDGWNIVSIQKSWYCTPLTWESFGRGRRLANLMHRKPFTSYSVLAIHVAHLLIFYLMFGKEEPVCYGHLGANLKCPGDQPVLIFQVSLCVNLEILWDHN